MKKRISQVYKVCILLIVVLMCVCTVAYAVSTYIDEGNTSYSYRLVPTGVGNQNDYSSGSGGYGGGYSGSSDYGGYSGGYGGYMRYGGYGGNFGNISFISIGIVILLIICIISIIKNNSNDANTGNTAAPSAPRGGYVKPSVNPSVEIQRTDPNFSEEAFLAWTREVFITLNVAWTKQDWKMIRPFESEQLFREHSQQLDEYIRNGTVNYLERVAGKDSFINKVYRDQSYEYVEVKMLTNMIDYVKETATGKIIAGNTTHLWEMIHTLTFMRTIGTKTSEHPESLSVTNCPNCGAPTEITSAGECPYCKSIVTSGTFNWVLCKFIGENL